MLRLMRRAVVEIMVRRWCYESFTVYFTSTLWGGGGKRYENATIKKRSLFGEPPSCGRFSGRRAEPPEILSHQALRRCYFFYALSFLSLDDVDERPVATIIKTAHQPIGNGERMARDE